MAAETTGTFDRVLKDYYGRNQQKSVTRRPRRKGSRAVRAVMRKRQRRGG